IDDALGDEVRVTVIAAGFDGGGPVQRRDGRALGQVSGSTARQVPAVAPVTTLPGASAVPTPRPVQVADEDLVPVGSSAATGASPQQEVPAFLSTEAEPRPVTGALEVPRVLAEEPPARRERDDLDVPDFLK
ncbi:MAG: cell division protein FtsZ, partial [Cellulomonas iranensis]|nr:cell division protein FtsZ [Cellulomonas iranensis]